MPALHISPQEGVLQFLHINQSATRQTGHYESQHFQGKIVIAEYKIHIGELVLFYDTDRKPLVPFHRTGLESSEVVHYVLIGAGNLLLLRDWDEALVLYTRQQRTAGQLYLRIRH